MSEITSGIRMTADASGLVGATDKGADAIGKATGQLAAMSKEAQALGINVKNLERDVAKITSSHDAYNTILGKTLEAEIKHAKALGQIAPVAKSAADESKAFVERLKEKADTLNKTTSQVERYRASKMQLTDAQRASVDASISTIRADELVTQAKKYAVTAVVALTTATIAFATATAFGVKSVIDQAAGVHNLSQSLGISTQGLSAYQYQMSLAGVTEREFENGMRNLAGRMAEAQQGVGKGEQVFRALGISVYDSAGRVKSLEQVMPEITERFTSFRDGVNKTALAGEVFGTKVGERIIPMLNQGAAGFQAAAREAEEFKRIIGPDMAKQADDFNANMTRINAMFMATKYAIAEWALPALNDFMERLVAAGKAKGNFVQKLLAGWGEQGDEDAEARAWQKKFDAQQRTLAGMMAKDAPTTSRLDKSKDPYDHAVVQLQNLIAVQELEASTTDKVTQVQRLRIQSQELLNKLVEQGREAEYFQINALLDEARANEIAAIAREKQKRAVEEATKAYNAGVEQQWKAIASLEDHNTKLAEHNREIGMTKAQIDLLRAARAEEALAIAQENLALTQMHDASEAELQLAQARVKAAQDLVRLLKEGAVAEAAHEGAKQTAEEFKRTSDNIERSLTDALMRGFDKGKSFGQNFLDALQGAFKTAILTPLIQPIVRPVANMVAGALQGLGSSIFGGGGDGGGFSLSNMFSGASTAYNAATGQGIFGGLSAGYGAGGAMTSSAIAGEAAALGVAGEYGALSGFGPYGMAAAAALAIFGGDLFGGGDKEPPPGFRRENWLQLQKNGGRYNVSSSEVPDPDVMRQVAAALDAALNDASQYDPEILDRFIGQSVMVAPGGKSQDLADALAQLLAPSSQSAQATKARNASYSAQLAGSLAGGGALLGSLQGYVDSQQVSQYLSPEDRLSGARGLFDSALARAGAGDLDAGRALQGLANQLLGAGRDVYASGGEFQKLRADVNSQLAAVIETQGATQASLLADMPIAIREAASDTIKGLERLRKDVVDALNQLNSRLGQFQATGVA